MKLFVEILVMTILALGTGTLVIGGLLVKCCLEIMDS